MGRAHHHHQTREKQRQKLKQHLCFTHPHFPRLKYVSHTPSSLTPLPLPYSLSSTGTMKNRALWLVLNNSFLLFLPSHFSPASAWVLCMSCSPSVNIHLLHYGLLYWLQGSLCFGAWRTSSPSFFADLGVHRITFCSSFFTSIQPM